MPRNFMYFCALLALLVASGCGTQATPSVATDVSADAHTSADSATTTQADWRKDGPYPVGHSSFDLTDAARNRTLRVTVWYPAAETARAAAQVGVSLADFYPTGSAAHTTLSALLQAAPPCVRKQTRSAADAMPTGKPWPTIAFSHCHGCTRFENTTLNERLASHGLAIVAPDHTGDTLLDEQAGTLAPLSTDFLQTRVADMRFVIDQVLDAKNPNVPEALRGRFDPTRLAVLGHSFGGVTAGKLLMDDARLQAGLALAVPMAQPLLPGVDMAAIHKPVGLVLAAEDNSIMTIGNTFLLQNFADANPPAWLWQVADAGHFSFADIAGLTPFLAAGCGVGERMADQSPFTYLDNATARQVGARIVGAFFARNLLGQNVDDVLLAAEPPGVVTATAKL